MASGTKQKKNIVEQAFSTIQPPEALDVEVMEQKETKVLEDGSQSISVFEFPSFELRSTEVTEEFESILLQILSEPPTSRD